MVLLNCRSSPHRSLLKLKMRWQMAGMAAKTRPTLTLPQTILDTKRRDGKKLKETMMDVRRIVNNSKKMKKNKGWYKNDP